MTAERVRLYAWGMFLAHAAVIIGFVLHDLLWPQGTPVLGNDFRVFWAASRLGLDGHGVDAYDINRLFPVQQAVAPHLAHAAAWQHWFYPPPFLLAVLPLALIPYFPSFLLFNAAGLCFYIWVLRGCVPLRGAIVVALASPAVRFTVVHGQNAFLTTGLIGLGLVLLERRPRLAGVLIGLLVIKPHLALLVAVALVAGGCWRALCWAAGSSLTLLAASLLLFSPQSALAFLGQVQVAKSFAEQGLLPLQKMPTVFASARLLGLQPGAANLIHVTVALSVTAAVAWLWNRRAAPYLRNSALILGCLLVSPHLFDYDLVWLTWPIGWISMHAIAHGWRRGEREVLVLTWAAPLFGELLAKLGFQITPLVILWLLAMLVWRELTQRATCGEPVTGPATGANLPDAL
jgi:hypothetical protein